MEEILQFKLSIEDKINIGLLILILYGIIEMAYLYFFKKYEGMRDYRQTTMNFGFVVILNMVVSSLIGVVSTSAFSLWAYEYSIFHADLSWFWWIIGLLVYEFFYWLQHWLAHKVRFLWCLHSPHHAPESMNMFVGFNHHFLETMIYMPFFLGFIPSLVGINPIIILTIAFVDIMWGNLLHINDKIMTKKYGLIEKILQTPSYHRVHHAQNVRYMDTNFNSITLFWDWALGTLQPLDDQEKVKFGITRDVDSSSFWDVQFGEFVLLMKDVMSVSSWKDKFLYLVMPPGWSHTGEHKTVSVLKKTLDNN